LALLDKWFVEMQDPDSSQMAIFQGLKSISLTILVIWTIVSVKNVKKFNLFILACQRPGLCCPLQESSIADGPQLAGKFCILLPNRICSFDPNWEKRVNLFLNINCFSGRQFGV
jgi:hypothetical protein